MNFLLLPIVIGSLLLLLFCLLVFYYFKKIKFRPDYSKVVPQGCNYKNIPFQAEQKWQDQDWGPILKENVSTIFFVHGTFVGNDPFDITQYITKLFPKIGRPVIKFIQREIKKGQNYIAKDLGNFSDEYVSKVSELVDHQVPCYNFHWSSANHHSARFKGALELLKFILDKTQQRPGRILLIGHSHAGQIFAILSQLMNSWHKRQNLAKLSDFFQEEPIKIKTMSKILAKYEFDIVTMGTPPRYEFILAKNIKLLHFINHRGKAPVGGNLAGMLFTKDGDYVQQWGISGSDTPSLLKEENHINGLLNNYLDEGSNRQKWQENIKFRRRLHSNGMNYLINYNDQLRFQNPLATAFGHGVYTKSENLLFTFELLTDYFYTIGHDEKK